MPGKNKNKVGVVFSTNPDFEYQFHKKEEIETLMPEKQNLKIRLDKKQRNGKQVTLIENFVGTESDAQSLGKDLKNACGAGGSVKDRLVMIQGDKRNAVLTWLTKAGYQAKISG